MKSCFNPQYWEGVPSSDLLSQLINLDQTSFPYPWPREQWPSTLSRYGSSGVSVLDQQGELQGFLLCLGQPGEDVAHLVKILTRPSLQQRGLASSMLKAWIHATQVRQRHRSLYLEVESTNNPALNFYLKPQFSVLRALTDFYGPKREAKAMALALDNKQKT